MGAKTRVWFTQKEIEAHEASLSENHFAVLMASLDKSYPEMATHLAIGIGTVKTRLNRARVALRKIMDKENADG